MQVYQETLVASQTNGSAGAPPNTSEVLEAADQPSMMTPSESTLAANLAAKAMALSGRSKNG